MWNADIYNYYGKERIQPSIDLVNRIRDKSFKRILDVGCGTGMSTAPLVATWKDAKIIGVDLSNEMLTKAKDAVLSATFIQRDCSKSLKDMGMFDLIFSNAFLQWIPNQEEFILNSFDMLQQGGIFAIQIPLFEEMPANECIMKAQKIMPDKFIGIESDKYILHSAEEYYDMVANVTNKISMWVTDYCHEMESYEELLEFLKGAALRPYINRLDKVEEREFMTEVLKNIENVYPYQKNGKILFPFKRLFLVGEK